MDLLVLAAGMGSRFGGLKQIEPIDERNNFIIDYSIFDAKRAGFDRVIFLIKEENREIFEQTVGKRFEKEMEVAYAYQKLEVIPEGYQLPADRVKPFGTAQAIYCCKDVIKDDFIIVNSDDFYGADSFQVAARFLKSLPKGSKGHYANIAYYAKNTLSETGSVKRGVLEFDQNNKLKALIESKIEWRGDDIYAAPLEGNQEMKKIPHETLVSMNMFAFSKDILDKIEENFVPFMESHKDRLADCEYMIPDLVSELIGRGEVSCDILSTTAVWHGVTYREDKPAVVKAIKSYVDSGVYPKERFAK